MKLLKLTKYNPARGNLETYINRDHISTLMSIEYTANGTVPVTSILLLNGEEFCVVESIDEIVMKISTLESGIITSDLIS